jgi:hypothetical protein
MKNRISTKAQAAIDQVIATFQSGNLGQVIQLATIKRQQGDTCPSSSWTLANLILAFFTTGGSLDARGYRQWQRVGRQVQRGQQAGCILVPMHKTIEDKAAGENKKQLIGFKAIAVFGVEQTEGEDLPTFDYTPADLPPLHDVALAMGVAVQYVPTGELGACAPDGSLITLGTEHPRTFWHELAHAVHARIAGKLKGGQNPLQETVAEFTACVLALLFGHDYSGNAWEYISHYNSDPLAAIMKALGTIEQVVAEIETVKASI